jgi:hypothetical protein
VGIYLGEASSTTVQDETRSNSDAESESEKEHVEETDEDRLRMLMDAMGVENLDEVDDECWNQYDRDFEFGVGTSKTTSRSSPPPHVVPDKDNETRALSTSNFSTPSPSAPFVHASRGKGKEKIHDTSK